MTILSQINPASGVKDLEEVLESVKGIIKKCEKKDWSKNSSLHGDVIPTHV